MRCVLAAVLLSAALSNAQSRLSGTVTDPDGDAIQSANVILLSLPGGDKSFSSTDSRGEFSFGGITPGRYAIRVTSIGYRSYEDTLEIAGGQNPTRAIRLEEEGIGEEEVVVSSTRMARDIAQVPFRIELLPAEDLDESITTGLASAKLVLTEVPGVITQVTSSGLGATSIRLHGLEGRYTQTLVDGIPAFGGLNLNYSVVQLPPLNLRQLEIVQGSASGIHNDAIGGIVNYITRTPSSRLPEVTSVVSYSSYGGTDVAALYGQRFGALGFLLHSTYDASPRKDIDGDDYADIPLQRRYNINPKLLFAPSDGTTFTFAADVTSEDRLGGQMSAPEDFSHGVPGRFSTALQTRRAGISAAVTTKPDSAGDITGAAAYAMTQRNSYRGLIPFDGTERFGYADAAWSEKFGALHILLGGSWMSQRFDETTHDQLSGASRSFLYTDASFYSQIELAFPDELTVMSSVRFDGHNAFGTAVSPAVSLMARPVSALTIRASAGIGWQAPTIFDETAEAAGFRGVPPMTLSTHERGHTLSIDARVKGVLGGWVLSTDLDIFQASVYDRVGLLPADTLPHPPVERYAWEGIGHEVSRGAEVLGEGRLGGLSLIFGYVFSDVLDETGETLERKLFTPRHFISGGAMWENPRVVRFALDYRIETSQRLPPNPFAEASPAFAIVDLSVEGWLTRSLSVSVNSENIFDARQTNTMPLYLGTPNRDDFNPDFVWGPVEGRVINVGMKFSM